MLKVRIYLVASNILRTFASEIKNSLGDNTLNINSIMTNFKNIEKKFQKLSELSKEIELACEEVIKEKLVENEEYSGEDDFCPENTILLDYGADIITGEHNPVESVYSDGDKIYVNSSLWEQIPFGDLNCREKFEIAQTMVYEVSFEDED